MQKKSFLSFLLVFCIAGSIGLFVRLYPLLNFSPDDSSEKATLLVVSMIKKEAHQRVERSFPHLPKTQKDILEKKLFDKLFKEESLAVKETIGEITKNINRSAANHLPSPYLLGSDSFNYYALSENILQTGTIGKIKGSKFYNPLMLAPLGHWEPLNLHPFIGAGIHKIISLFSPEAPLMYSVGFTPLLITLLTIIPFLVILSLLEIGPEAALLSSVSFLLSPIFLKRSFFGWYDNDPYNLLFPLLIFSAFLWGIKNRQYLKSGILTAFFLMLYALFWHGWGLMFCSLSGNMLVFIFLNFFSRKKESKRNILIFLLTFMGMSFVFIGGVLGFKDFFVLFAEGWKALKNFLEPQLSVWPDLYLSVGELHATGFKKLMRITGGPFFVLTAFFGAAVAVIRILKQLWTKATTRSIWMTACLLAFFFLTLYLGLNAERFAIFFLIPAGIFFAYAAEFLFSLIRGLRFNILHSRRSLAAGLLIVAIVTALSIIQIMQAEKKAPSLMTQIYNSTWDSALTKIEKNTPTGSIINTWWPPGHFIKAIAKRRVTFDGATINYPQSYWLCNIFLSQNEQKAAGMLRTLNNSGNKAVELLESFGFPVSVAVAIIKDISVLNEKQAIKKLKTVIDNPKLVLNILSFTHAPPPPSYILLYNELVQNNVQMKFIGGWNFQKIEEINSNPELLRNVPKRHSPEYIDFLWGLAGGPYKFSGILPQISKKNNIVYFQDNIKVDLKSKSCFIDSKTYKKGIPYSIFYTQDDDVQEHILEHSNLPYSLVLFKEGSSYNAILMDRALAKSLLIRLYFFNAKGLKYFKPFLKESDLTKRTVISAFSVDWEKFREDINNQKP